jgi:hypothetical protein
MTDCIAGQGDRDLTSRDNKSTLTPTHNQPTTHPPHRKWLGVRVGGSRNRGGGGSVIRGEYVRIGRIRWDPRRILPTSPPPQTPFLPPSVVFSQFFQKLSHAVTAESQLQHNCLPVRAT